MITMSTISPEERDEMKRILELMEGKTPSVPMPKPHNQGQSVELAGAGQVTKADIDAMSMVLNKLNAVTEEAIHEGYNDPAVVEAMETKRIPNGVKVGNYQIMIKEDPKRLAGKQYYSIYHSKTGDVIADDITLYETALAVVKKLNNGKFVNDSGIRALFEADDTFTAHKTDAVRFKSRIRQSEKTRDFNKVSIYESRYQASLDNAMQAKKQIRKLIS